MWQGFRLRSNKWEVIMKNNKNKGEKDRKKENKPAAVKSAGKKAVHNDQKVEDQSNYEYRANDEDLKDDKSKNYSEAGKFSGGAQSQKAGDQGNSKLKRSRKGPSTQ